MLVLAPTTMVGPARLVTVAAVGAVEQLRFEGVSAVVMPTEVVPVVEPVRAPALAVDAGRRRAYVVVSPLRPF